MEKNEGDGATAHGENSMQQIVDGLQVEDAQCGSMRTSDDR